VPPIALVEVQGYVVAAFDAMASMARRLGNSAEAHRLRARAVALRRRIEQEFWVEATRFFALAVDGAGRQVPTIASNPGHLLFCRATSLPRAARIAEVLLSDGLFSGWGVRTLARGQAVYNPLSYHNGTVWPHDNALCGLGLAQAGFPERAQRLLEGLYAASLHFRDLRLPELFCGMPRGEGDSLVHYPVSCSPQAWASAAFFLLLQAVLGVRPDAEHGRLVIKNPRLPGFLSWYEVHRMRVGRALVSLRFERSGSRTHVDLVDVSGDPSLRVSIEVG
jgi:glycogen debranching enzyme